MNNKKHRLLSALLLIGLMISVGGVHAWDREKACKGCHDGYKNVPFLVGKSSAAAHHPANPDKDSLIYKNLYSKCKACHTTPTMYEKRCVNCHKPEIDDPSGTYPSIPFLKAVYLPNRHHDRVGKPIGDTGEVYECLSCHAVEFDVNNKPTGYVRGWSDCGSDEPSVLPADFVCYKQMDKNKKGENYEE